MRRDSGTIDSARFERLAYRMLGSWADAEEAVQEARLRLHRELARGTDIRSPEAWLTTALSRLCIDRLRARKSEQQAYVGPWLPEPLIGESAPPDFALDLASDLSMAFLVILERLSPEERAAFLLREAFDCGYDEIARMLGKSEAASRQIVHRARERVRHEKPRFEVPPSARRDVLARYLDALQAGDADRLVALFAEDATLTSDGGGKRKAALNVIRGAERIVRLELGVRAKHADTAIEERLALVNGEPGIVAWSNGEPLWATAIETDGRRILSVFRVLNPDKLNRIVKNA